MDQYSTDTSDVLRFTPGQKPRSKADPIDDAGRALVAMLQEAANISKENVDRAMTVAHKLSGSCEPPRIGSVGWKSKSNVLRAAPREPSIGWK
jgi:hypothetical protein